MQREVKSGIHGRSLEEINVDVKRIAIVGAGNITHIGYAAKILLGRYPDAEVHIVARATARERLRGRLGGSAEWFGALSDLKRAARHGAGNAGFDLAVFLSGNPDMNDGGWARMRMLPLRAKLYAIHYLEPAAPDNLFGGSSNYWLLFTGKQWKRDAALTAASSVLVKIQYAAFFPGVLFVVAPLLRRRLDRANAAGIDLE
ncbi:MAG: hypothetical protein AB1742_08630 [bacterium]